MKRKILNNAGFADTGLGYAISELDDEKVEVRRNAVTTCIQTGKTRRP